MARMRLSKDHSRESKGASNSNAFKFAQGNTSNYNQYTVQIRKQNAVAKMRYKLAITKIMHELNQLAKRPALSCSCIRGTKGYAVQVDVETSKTGSSFLEHPWLSDKEQNWNQNVLIRSSLQNDMPTAT